ncbi:MAG: riboflavin synthase [Synergistaceae bacterium]|nr:riboflavin synthase [Synergistaceae bacterium]
MFTGLVEAVGTVRDFSKTESVFRLSVECPAIAPELKFGQSVAVCGACLTVVSAGGGVFAVEMMPETYARTRFSGLTRGSRVNLERAMRLDGRLEGHLVLGHVDGTAALEKLKGPPDTKTAWFRAPESLTRHIVGKGSIAVDGVSLTVIDAEKDSFSVGLIPVTLENSTLGLLKPGDAVNIETDIVGKYVERLLKRGVPDRGAASAALTLEGLCELGYG